MIPLYTKAEFDSAKSRDKLPLKCVQCNNQFSIPKYRIHRALNQNLPYHTGDFCSKNCIQAYWNPPTIVSCAQCKKHFKKQYGNIQRTNNHFCSRSCAAKYNNKHKKQGTRRSKLEKWLEEQLPNLYPNLEFHFNRKDAIESELDIYIPSLRLAFELNGIYHYEPIHGQDKLDSIQANDQQKFAACYERNIELCTIDTSSFSYFKEHRAMKFLNIIQNIIDARLSDS